MYPITTIGTVRGVAEQAELYVLGFRVRDVAIGAAGGALVGLLLGALVFAAPRRK